MGYLKSFVLFLGMIGLGAFYAVVVLFRWGDTSLNRDFTQKFSKFVRWFLGIKLEVIHPERITNIRPVVFVANHQSGMDMALIGHLCPTDTVLIGKKEILYIPFFGICFSIYVFIIFIF